MECLHSMVDLSIFILRVYFSERILFRILSLPLYGCHEARLSHCNHQQFRSNGCISRIFIAIPIDRKNKKQ